VDDARYRSMIGENAKATMRAHFSPVAAGLRYARRLEQLATGARNISTAGGGAW
jgi:hypothetical protein